MKKQNQPPNPPPKNENARLRVSKDKQEIFRGSTATKAENEINSSLPTPIFDLLAEDGVLGAMMKNPKVAESCTGLTAAHFSAQNAPIFLALADLHHRDAPTSSRDAVDLLDRRGELNDAGGAKHIYRLEDEGSEGESIARHYLTEIHRAFRGRRGREIAREFQQSIDSGEDIATALSTLNAAQIALERLGNTGIGKVLEARRFSISQPPPTPLPIYSIGGVCIATAGNLTAITGQAKSGKSSLLSALIAAAHSGEGDTLGVNSFNDGGGALIHFDTEQSRHDHHSLVMLAMRRAGRPSPLPWFRSYCLTDLSPGELCAALTSEAAAAADAHGFIHSIIIDGIADLCADVNDPTETAALLLNLRALSIKYSCPVVCVLHENPSKEGGQNKTRGHLGSHLERKAFASLTLSKNTDGVVSVFSGNSRKLHIAREGAPSFVWNNDAGMHITCDSPTPSPSAKRETRKEHLTHLLDEVYGGRLENITLSFRHQKLLTELMERTNKGETTIKKMITDMLEFRLIKKGEGKGEEDRYSRC